MISESSILDDVDTKKCLRVRSIKDWTRGNYADSKAKKQKKEDEGKKYETNDELLIVDHNFTTIFRQPDGSAG